MQIEREGRVTFGDATIHIWEDPERRSTAQWQDWEKDFKRQVFKRAIQQLNRMGWTVGPWDEAEHYKPIANDRRTCHKGELHGQLEISGRTIKFEMWQDKYNIDREDGRGKYEFDKERRMPYAMRKRMDWTRRRLCKYLCNVFSGYQFKSDRSDGRSNKRGPNHLTGIEWIEGCWESSWHYDGNWEAYIAKDEYSRNHNRKTANGTQLNQGDRVYFFDRKGRIQTGIAYYNINNMWWVLTGKYDVKNESSTSLYTTIPENFRAKHNQRLRRGRLENELSKAVKAMDFKRAETLKSLLFPETDELYVVWHKEHGAYHRANWSGYTASALEAGKFTKDEISRMNKNTDKAILLR